MRIFLFLFETEETELISRSDPFTEIEKSSFEEAIEELATF